MAANQPQTDTNKQKPTLSLKDQARAEEAAAAAAKQVSDAQQEAPEITNDPNSPGFVSLSEIASQGYDALHEAYRRQNAIKPKEYVPPPLTERQRARLEEEMAAGSAAVARHAAQQSLRPPPERTKAEIDAEGTSVPVFRPADHIPGLNSRDPGVK